MSKEILTNNGLKGGMLKGKAHYDSNGNPIGGIKAIVTDQGGKPIEVEGNEVIINKKSVQSDKVLTVKGTPKEILSTINQLDGNGVAIGDEEAEILAKYRTGGELIKRADGSYSERGLWDNIRDNIGSGRKPTKQMLEQEAKIRSKYHLGGDMSKHLAPNGKPSNLNHEQWHLVRTPEFKEWFGDWENDPENASKVVDEETKEPLVVYHGTYVENPFYIFDFDKADLGFHFGTYEQAKDRSEKKLFFKGRKSIVNSFFLNIKTIFESTDIGEWEYPQRYIDMFVSDGLINESDAKKNGFYRLIQREENKQIREYLLNKYGKFSGFVYNNKYEGKGKSFIVLNTTQIKLADGTNTTFDGNNPDIRFEAGGEIEQMIKNGSIDLKLSESIPEHAEIYGLKAEKPLFVQNLIIDEKLRLKVLEYIDSVAKRNGNDMIFGHINNNNTLTNKSWLHDNGYSVNEDNNDFYKVVIDNKFKTGGSIKPDFSKMSKSEIKEFYNSPEGKKLDAETYAEWKRLVNMSKSELKKFYNSEEGKKAGLTPKQASEQGIDSGRESARWIMKMKNIPYRLWSSDMWIWAKKQISFIKRMTGMKGDLYDENGNKTRKHTALLIWGNNPEKDKFAVGGGIESEDPKTYEEIREYSENILKEFNPRYSAYSDTNGQSMYFNVGSYENPIKVRFSDHSVTNIDRISNEVHFSLRNVNSEYTKFMNEQKILELRYRLGDDSIVNEKREMLMPSGKLLQGFGYSKKYEQGGGIEIKNNKKIQKPKAIKSELAKGTKHEMEHLATLKKVAEREITPEQAVVETAKTHIEENPEYYEDLAKMEKENKKYDWDFEFTDGDLKGQKFSNQIIESIEVYNDSYYTLIFKSGGIFNAKTSEMVGLLSITDNVVKLAVILDENDVIYTQKIKRRVQSFVEKSNRFIVNNNSNNRIDKRQYPYLLVSEKDAENYDLATIFYDKLETPRKAFVKNIQEKHSKFLEEEKQQKEQDLAKMESENDLAIKNKPKVDALYILNKKLKEEGSDPNDLDDINDAILVNRPNDMPIGYEAELISQYRETGMNIEIWRIKTPKNNFLNYKIYPFQFDYKIGTVFKNEKTKSENENKSILESQIRGLELLVPMIEGEQKNIIEKQIRGLKLLVNIA